MVDVSITKTFEVRLELFAEFLKTFQSELMRCLSNSDNGDNTLGQLLPYSFQSHYSNI